MRTVVQISLDLVEIPEALRTAVIAIEAGVDWLEAGTPLIIAEGMNGVRALREAFPAVPIVADLKTMDGGWLEAELMAKAGATHVVVMERAHPSTVRMVVQAGRDLGIAVMGDNLGADDPVKAARRLEDLGCDFVIHHVGYDQRRELRSLGEPELSPLDDLARVVSAVDVPVQAVGGLSIEQAMRAPELGSPLVVLGAPLTIDAESFTTAAGDLDEVLASICRTVHSYGDVGPAARRLGSVR